MGAAFALLALGACTNGEPSRDGAAPAAAVATGMTKAQVLEVWGRPSLKVLRPSGERWSYWVRDDRHHVVGQAYVLFDEGERVLDVVTRGGGWPGQDGGPWTIT